MKYGRMIYMGDLSGNQFVVFNSLEEAQEGRHPEARGIGAIGPIFELTGRRWEGIKESRIVWTEKGRVE